MLVTSLKEIKQWAKLLCDDLECVNRGVKGFAHYDTKSAKRELLRLRKWYIKITGSSRCFPVVVQAD